MADTVAIPVDPTRIGVLLPLTGKFAPVGLQVKRGIELAFDKLPASSMGPFNLVYRDTQDDPELTEKAVRQLVEDEHVVAIVGPLVSSTVDAAAITATELQVPMLALSQKSDIPYLGNYVFRNFMTPEFQIKTLVAYAMETLKLKRFGIIYQEQPYWMELAGIFWDEVVARGGEIAGVESYLPDTTDFDEVAKRIGRKYYVDLRKWELAEGRRKMKDAYRRAGKEPPAQEYELPPIVDYDAIFISDQYRNASLVAATLAHTEFPVGGFTVAHTKQRVILLGNSSWNTPDLLRQGGDFVEHCLIVDNFFRESPDPAVQDFVKAFRAANGKAPDIFAAIGYDSVNLMGSLLRERPLDRAGLVSRLANIENYSGATGKIAFDEHGELKKDLFVISVKRKKFEQLVPVLELPNQDKQNP